MTTPVEACANVAKTYVRSIIIGGQSRCRLAQQIVRLERDRVHRRRQSSRRCDRVCRRGQGSPSSSVTREIDREVTASQTLRCHC